MKYRLGLDLGTNSIGWAVYALDSDNEPIELTDMGVRIFSDGRDPQTKEPLAVARRTARGQRKLIYRHKLRRKATFRLLQEQGLFPKTKEETQKLKSLNPYELRVKALDTKLEPYELARVLFNLSVRRGFKSNRKDAAGTETGSSQTTAKEKLSQGEKCAELTKAIAESGCRTLGEFLWKHQQKNRGLRFVPGRTDYYPLRSMYTDEFNAIRAVQEPFYKTISWQAVYDAIFFQRRLEPQERGRCRYMPEKERTFKAMPCAQKVRMLQDIRNLNYRNECGQTVPVTESESQVLLKLLDTKEKVTFDAFRKALHLNEACVFNLERSREFLPGNKTAVKLRGENFFGSLWDTLSLETQDTIVEKLITADDDDEVRALLEHYELTDTQLQAIVKVQLPAGTTMLCREASEQLVHKMETTGCDFTTAVQALGYKDAEQTVEKSDTLPYYGKVLIGSTMGADPAAGEDTPELKYGKIGNPTVHVALNQTRTVVNALIRQYGKPAQIVVELSRDLKASREAKAAIQKKQRENKARNELLNKNITEAYNIPYPNRSDRLRYRLWEELGAGSLPRKCLYCGKTISGAELFSKNIEIEHILPYSRTLLDAESNLTVAHASCNAFKKERSPYEAFGSSPNGYSWQHILDRANQLKNPAKRARFAEDAMQAFEKESGFIARQLTDNAYLSKMALKYLKCVCEDIWAVNGGMTKLLRDEWRIDSILKRKIDDKEIAYFGLTDAQIGEYKKNRYDHRHHALDASVIALIDRSLVQRISTLNARSQKNRIEVPPMAVPRLELQEKVRHIVVSFKPDHGAQGKLSKETLLGKIKQETLVAVGSLEADDIPLIKNDRVRADFEKELAQSQDIKRVRKALKDVYPQVKVYKEYYVARTALAELKEKNIEDIVDCKIRTSLQDFAKRHTGEKFENILEQFSRQTGIQKIRCINRVQTPIVIDRTVPRYLAPEDYFAAIIWQIPPKKDGIRATYEAQYIRRTEVGKDNKPKASAVRPPHPAAKNLGILHKDDYLEFCDSDQWYKCRVAGFSATQNKLDIRPVSAVTDCADWIITTNDMQLERCWKQKKGQNYISVNILFGEKQARFITVNPIGRVFRK